MKRTRGRVVGLDIHPDTFAGGILEGKDPATAKITHTSTQVPLPQLEAWALRHTKPEDTLVMEASGNAFAVAARLKAIGRNALVMESHMAGKIGKTYCANDRVDAIKIARIYLSGLSPLVWQPDERTSERRELFSAYQSVVRETTRLQQHIKSMLNEHCLRLPPGFRLTAPGTFLRLKALKDWTPIQLLLLEQMHAGLVCARARRQKLRHQMALEMADDPELLRLARLTGLNLITIYGMTSAIGDIHRFANPKKLVAYLGLNPSVAQSGNWQGSGALKRHGRGALRALLVQAAQRLLHVENPLQKWGLALSMRRGRNKAAVAIARKLTVAIWHILMGHPIGAVDNLQRLETKIFKLATDLGVSTLKSLGFPSKDDFVQKKLYVLQNYP
jgi:transposase